MPVRYLLGEIRGVAVSDLRIPGNTTSANASGTSSTESAPRGWAAPMSDEHQAASAHTSDLTGTPANLGAANVATARSEFDPELVVGSDERPLGFAVGPMGLSQKLDGAWALFRSRFGQFLGLSFAISTPLYVLTAIAQRGLGGGFLGVWQAQLNQIENTAPNPGGDVFLAGLVAMAGSLPLFLLGVVIARVVRAALEGKVLKASGALRIGWRTLLAVLATWVVSRLIIGAGILVCFLPGLLAMAMLSISAPVIAFEDARGVRSIGRSYGLTSRYFGTAMACVVATAFMNMVVSMGTSGIVYAAAFLIGAESIVDWLWFPAAVAGLVTTAVVNALTACVACVLYLDLRSRRDGWDLRREITAAFGAGAGTGPSAGAGGTS